MTAPIRTLMGVETEYAMGGSSRRADQLMHMMRLGRRHFKYLPGHAHGDMFLGNGARIYIDCVEHPEVCTPECTNPTDLVRYVLAGERMLEAMLTLFRKDIPGSGEIRFYKSNVDYSGAGTTWGCHESYLCHKRPMQLSDDLIPHLVSRILYTGAGGFNPLSPGIVPTLSPRVYHMSHVVADGSTEQRGIFHAKNESLSNSGMHRLHLICGESVCSHLANYLKVGTTALLVALVDQGLHPGAGLKLSNPLQAMHIFAEDFTLSQRVRMASGRQLSAVEIQRRYLEEVEKHLERLPDWAGAVCRRWRDVLDRLEQGPEAVQTRLDWAIKWMVFRNHAARRGVAWDKLSALTSVADAMDIVISPVVGRRKQDRLRDRLESRVLRDFSTPRIRRILEINDLDRDDLDRFMRVRDELFEIDMRFGELGPESIFASLEKAGVLHHQAPGVQRIGLAMRSAPSDTRAQARGKAVRKFSGREGYCCDWQSVNDFVGRRVMYLGDPFEVKGSWTKRPAPPRRGVRETRTRELFERLVREREERMRRWRESGGGEPVAGARGTPVGRGRGIPVAGARPAGAEEATVEPVAPDPEMEEPFASELSELSWMARSLWGESRRAVLRGRRIGQEERTDRERDTAEGDTSL